VVLTDERFGVRHAEARAALMRGYRSIRDLGAEEESLLDAFVGARLAVHAIRVAATFDTPALAAERDRFMMGHMARLRSVLWS
jgi:Ser/Thr protein kinase RdoA (MazF antagonist)